MAKTFGLLFCGHMYVVQV